MAEEPICEAVNSISLTRESEEGETTEIKDLNKDDLKKNACYLPKSKGAPVPMGQQGDKRSSVPRPSRAAAPASPLASGGVGASLNSPEPNDTELASLLVPDRLKFEVDEEGIVNDSSNTEKKDDEVKDVFKEFEIWLKDNGAKFPDLYLKRYTGDVRGVHAERRVGPYVCLVQIPVKCLITDYMGRTETDLGRKLFSSNYSLSTPNLIAVIIYILTTREDKNHFFQPYYRILPSDYSNFPIFWNKEELSWLTGSPLLEDIEERKCNMRADYDEVVRVCPEFGRFSFEEFLEIRTAVGSRNFGIVVHGDKRTAMVPYADMLNHYRPRETSWTFDDSKDSFTITSLSPLQAGQQVMDSYGKKCNSKFLLHYGFAVECNREEDGKCQNEIYIRLFLKNGREDSLYETRLSILGPSRSSRGFRLSMNFEDKATAEALSYCRIAVATAEELDQVLSARGGTDGANTSYRQFREPPSYRDSAISFISVRNEAAALEMLATGCQRQLDRYPDTYESNKALLASGATKPFSTRRTALIVILSEQEICHFWINVYEAVSSVFENNQTPSAIYSALRVFTRTTPTEADLARFTARIAYEMRTQLKE